MYISVKEAARKWGISERRVRILCEEGRVDGVLRTSWAWNIPVDAPKPADGRQLRHMKNLDMRIGTLDYDRLETEVRPLRAMSDTERFLSLMGSLTTRYVLCAFATEDIQVDPKELAVLFNHSMVSSMDFEVQILALNLRSIILRMIHQYGLGPIEGKLRAQMSEQQLNRLMLQLTQGLEENLVLYCDSDRKTEMESLFIQYERDWSQLNPLLRALLFYGEVVRIRPFGRYDGLLAALALAQELIVNDYPPVLFDVERSDEFKAALVVTRRFGNYTNVMHIFEQSMLMECAKFGGNA